MSKYLERTTEWMRWLEERIAKTDDPRYKAITRDYISHLALEMTGNWQRVWAEMLVEDPEYHVYAPATGIDRLTTYSGRQEVKDLYSNKVTTLSHAYGPMEASFEAFDWGFVSFITSTLLLDGETMIPLGFDVDGDARYVVELPVLNRWWYDGKARLIGEDAHQLAEPVVSNLEPVDDISPHQRLAALKPFCPK
jgi:hypothetical protein